MKHEWLFGSEFEVVKSYSASSHQVISEIGCRIVLKKGESMRLFQDDDEYVLFVLKKKKKGGSADGKKKDEK